MSCAGCNVASVVSEVALTAGDWEVDSKEVSSRPLARWGRDFRLFMISAFTGVLKQIPIYPFRWLELKQTRYISLQTQNLIMLQAA